MDKTLARLEGMRNAQEKTLLGKPNGKETTLRTYARMGE